MSVDELNAPATPPSEVPGDALQRRLAAWGLWLGPVAGALAWWVLRGEESMVGRAACVCVLMAVWWMTEALPLAATALVPVALFPLLGVMSGKAAAALYFNDVIFLFTGGFLLALAMQRWDLHTRIALRILQTTGVRPAGVLFGFMAATAGLSMWVSNTATTMMMLPIVLAVVAQLETAGSGGDRRQTVGLLLGVAYAATIGGMATVIGSPPNAVLLKIFEERFPAAEPISFAQWFMFCFPISLFFLLVAWAYLAKRFRPEHGAAMPEAGMFREQRRALGRIRYEELVVMIVFFATVFLWMFRRDIALGSLTIPGWDRLLPTGGLLDDGTIAIGAALLLFMIPSSRGGGDKILDWETAVKIPWGILLLFGGGFALAKGMETSGLSVWMGDRLGGLHQVHPLLLVWITCVVVTFLGELASNTAMAQIMLPILAQLAVTVKVHPLFFLVPATVACSLGFMLPVATPPNAITFSTGRIRTLDMMRAGFVLNILGGLIVTAATWLLGGLVFGAYPGVFPEWAR